MTNENEKSEIDPFLQDAIDTLRDRELIVGDFDPETQVLAAADPNAEEEIEEALQTHDPD
ncbi:hypothetical protein F6R98_10325 [Candidatus Methylospira mobilis]|uniref:Uncharacterized protein n=1 Tax=Candidatus Methylospira mobilis TaxID=1808979 RepID=A0A5Q0BHD2_9GAMM|nr:hypothetical protein [Candidatus Methylospira mobilis]QFY42959.1 hypothetical protein F6R98_10325 [Candidatus Methylospira mobilis]